MWEAVYKKWFNSNWEIAQTLTIIILSLLAVAGVLLIILGGKAMHDEKTTPAVNVAKLDEYKKKKIKYFSVSIVCFLAPVLWPIIITIIDKAGLGQIIGGENKNIFAYVNTFYFIR